MHEQANGLLSTLAGPPQTRKFRWGPRSFILALAGIPSLVYLILGIPNSVCPTPSLPFRGTSVHSDCRSLGLFTKTRSSRRGLAVLLQFASCCASRPYVDAHPTLNPQRSTLTPTVCSIGSWIFEDIAKERKGTSCVRGGFVRPGRIGSSSISHCFPIRSYLTPTAYIVYLLQSRIRTWRRLCWCSRSI